MDMTFGFLGLNFFFPFTMENNRRIPPKRTMSINDVKADTYAEGVTGCNSRICRETSVWGRKNALREMRNPCNPERDSRKIPRITRGIIKNKAKRKYFFETRRRPHISVYTRTPRIATRAALIVTTKSGIKLLCNVLNKRKYTTAGMVTDAAMKEFLKWLILFVILTMLIKKENDSKINTIKIQPLKSSMTVVSSKISRIIHTDPFKIGVVYIFK
jgi:hypothetical protein